MRLGSGLRRLLAPSLLGFGLLVAAGTSGQQLDGIVAIVNGDVILASEFQEELGVLRQQLQAAGVTLPDESTFQDQVLERLIMRRLQLDYAAGIGLVVDDETINRAAREVAEQNGMGLMEFQQALSAQNLSFDAFRENLRTEILIARLHRREIDRRVDISERDISQFLDSEAAITRLEYRLSSILIGIEDATDTNAVREARRTARAVLEELDGGADFDAVARRVSDGPTASVGGDLGWIAESDLPEDSLSLVQDMEVGEYRGPLEAADGITIIRLDATRSERAQFVEQVRARHILVRTDETVTDEDARLQLASLLRRLGSGEAFADLARIHSDDPGSSGRGGDLGWLNPGDTVPEFEAVLDQLGIGEVSEPFQTAFGWHIVEVRERRNHDSTEDYRRQMAVEQIRSRRGEEVLDSWLRRLRDEAFVEKRLFD